MKKICLYIFTIGLMMFLMSCQDAIQTSLTDGTQLETSEISTSQVSDTSQTSTTDLTTQSTNIYVVSFEVGMGQPINDLSVEAGSSIDLPISTREGYTFMGWTLSGDVNAEVLLGPFEPDNNITLYAKWQINQYSISFESNGGSPIDDITQDYNTEVTSPEEPFMQGYLFDGWYLDENLNNLYIFSLMPAEDITLYAKWLEINWSDVETYLDNIVPTQLSENLSLPDQYLEYTIRWESSDFEILTNEGFYQRPYQPTLINLTARIVLGNHTFIKSYDIQVEAYKSLSLPLASSYIYRDYDLVSDTFFETLDIINCAFITANSAGTLSGSSVLNNINTYIMPKARENGNWVIFSIAPSSDWSAIASSDSRINTFADNIVTMINTFGFDGVDIDWETPREDEAERFTQMMQVIYTKVKANNPNHLVTAAIAGGMWQPPRYDLSNSHQYLDYINMMTYGMVSNNGYYQNALYESRIEDNPLYDAGKTLTSCSIEESIEIYHSYGIPNHKIIVGVAFYGIKQTRTYNTSTQTWSDWVNAGSVSFTYIHHYYLSNDTYDYHYDNAAGVPYIIRNDGTVFISYDNPRSIAEKAEYIIDQGLAGMMYWENGLDSSGLLLNAMQSALDD
jgi:chitinase